MQLETGPICDLERVHARWQHIARRTGEDQRERIALEQRGFPCLETAQVARPQGQLVAAILDLEILADMRLELVGAQRSVHVQAGSVQSAIWAIVTISAARSSG